MQRKVFAQLMNGLIEYYRDDAITQAITEKYWDAWRREPDFIVREAVKLGMQTLTTFKGIPQIGQFRPLIENIKARERANQSKQRRFEPICPNLQGMNFHALVWMTDFNTRHKMPGPSRAAAIEDIAVWRREYERHIREHPDCSKQFQMSGAAFDSFLNEIEPGLSTEVRGKMNDSSKVGEAV